VIAFQSFRERLTNELKQIEGSLVELGQNSRIKEFRNDPNSDLVFFTYPYSWEPLAIEHRSTQARLLTQYQHWYELFYRCHARHSSDVQDKLETVNKYVLSAIELKTDWATSSTLQENRSYLLSQLALFYEFLEHPVRGDAEFIVVPDTNALLQSADPVRFKTIVSNPRFRFVIVPTVLAELDGLKRSRANQPLGEKAEKAIRMIKGFRNQGSVLDGVIVAKTITVQMIATEPRMIELPSWLDPDNQDDRIIGSVLEIQCGQPTAGVVLVTDDMNLQNKAEMAFVPWSEPPSLPVIAGSLAATPE
jgi:rRNA-processing protein FCF1